MIPPIISPVVTAIPAREPTHPTHMRRPWAYTVEVI
jgi:hypothetical protein